MTRSTWIAWALLGVWSVWIFALQGLCAARMGSSTWIPDVGLVVLLSLAARLSHEDLPKAALIVAVARCAVSIDAPVAVLAGYGGAIALARALRGVFEISGALPRTLLAGANAWLVAGWLAFAHELRDARVVAQLTGAAPDLGQLGLALTSAWPTALSSALTALVLGPLLGQLPGLSPLAKKHRWHVVASYPWS